MNIVDFLVISSLLIVGTLVFVFVAIHSDRIVPIKDKDVEVKR